MALIFKNKNYSQKGLTAPFVFIVVKLLSNLLKNNYSKLLKASLIISVYRKKEELGLVFRMLALQSSKDFEVIVADDDSGNSMEEYSRESAEKYGLRMKFVTHSFNGFGKNKILNKAIKSSESDYLIFIDGDCLPHKHFIREHLKASDENTVLCGRRVMLGDKLSDKIKIEPQLLKKGSINYLTVVNDKINTKVPSNYAEESIYLGGSPFTSLINKKVTLVGCNFSLPKALMEKINGFNEDYTGPGIGEDSDIEYRLLLAGAKLRSVRNKAILYHLYHPLTKENNNNYDYFNNVVKKEANYYCRNGLVKN